MSSRSIFLVLIDALRVRQWPKNVLVFVPLIAGHFYFDQVRGKESIAIFALFCLAASSMYLINDIVDRHADRIHPTKRFRPVASGELSVLAAGSMAAVLLGISIVGSVWLSPVVLGMIGAYLATSLAYSFYFKKKMLLDVVCLSFLYTLRVGAGHIALHVPYSGWIFGFFGFLFFSLAMLKRYGEILHSGKHSERRGYRLEDLNLLLQFGVCSGYLSVLVFALYISSSSVQLLYSHPIRLWLACPVLLFWISRVWMKMNRKEISEDPVEFSLSDPVSYGMIATLFAIVALAI